MNLGGKIRLADLVQPLVEKYDFKGAPTKLEDFDFSKGVKFEYGKAGGLLVQSLVLFDGAIYVDTIASTEDSKQVLFEMLEWAKSAFGLNYDKKLIRRWGHVSDLVFQTDFPLLESISPPFNRLAEKTSRFTEEVFEGLQYKPTVFTIGHDPVKRSNGIAGFTIQHRAGTSHNENIYYSEAPLPTHLHIQYLEEFEKDVLASRK